MLSDSWNRWGGGTVLHAAVLATLVTGCTADSPRDDRGLPAEPGPTAPATKPPLTGTASPGARKLPVPLVPAGTPPRITGGPPPSVPDDARPLRPDAPVRIVAVELQFEDPSPGGQAVWVRNEGRSTLALSCWSIGSQSTGGRAHLPADARVGPGTVVRLVPPDGVLRPADVLTLRDGTGRVVDTTPRLVDDAADDRRWQLGPGRSWRLVGGPVGTRGGDVALSEAPANGC